MNTETKERIGFLRFMQKTRSLQIYLTGTFLFRTADWMDLTVLNWAVLQLTESALALAVINTCRLLPTFVLSLPAGTLADRYNRRRLLIALQTGYLLTTLVLVLLFWQQAPFYLVAAFVVFRSFFISMDPPIRQAWLPHLTEKAHMSRALALQVAVMNISRMIGLAVAGWLLTIMEIPLIFLVTCCITIVVITTLITIEEIPYQHREHIPAPTPPANSQIAAGHPKFAAIREMNHYIRQHPQVQSLLWLAMVPMLFGFPYTSLLPVFASTLLNAGPQEFGFLLSTSAIGALCASGWLTVRGEQKNAGKLLIASIIAFGFGLIMFMLSSWYLFSCCIMFFIGLSSQLYRTLSRITLQTQVPDSLRGRILSLALMDRGLIPLGTVLIGILIDTIGVRFAGMIMGTGCILATLIVTIWRKHTLTL
jgi:MFS family permease